jgi:DeoR/GlpR family transcriptional regulator of sugar metabolism
MTEELNSRQIKIVDYLETNRRASRQELTDIIGVSFMTIYRDLQELMDKKYVEQKGKGRGTYYRIQDDEKGVEVKEDIPVFGKTEDIQVF